MARLDEIIEAVDALDPFERKRLAALLAAKKRGDDGQLSRQEQYVADAVREITRRRLPSLALIDLGLRPQAAELFDFLDNQIEGLREPQIAALVTLCLSALADHLQNRGSPVPVTPKTLLANIPHMARAVDRAYPGYHRAGILRVLVSAVVDTAA